MTKLLREDRVIIHGNVKIAQLLVDFLQQVKFNFEEELSKWRENSGVIVHQVGKIAKKFKLSDNLLISIKDEITNFLITLKWFY